VEKRSAAIVSECTVFWQEARNMKQDTSNTEARTHQTSAFCSEIQCHIPVICKK